MVTVPLLRAASKRSSALGYGRCFHAVASYGRISSRLSKGHSGLYDYAQNCARNYASKSFPDHQIVAMPALSPTMSQGNLASWIKQPGDEVAAGDVLAEIETDKAQMEFEVQDEGIIAKILVEAGSKDIPVGSPIAVFVESADQVEAFKDFTIEDAGGVKEKPKQEEPKEKKEETPAPSKKAATEAVPKEQPQEAATKPEGEATDTKPAVKVSATPAARRIASERGIPLQEIKGSGPNGRIIQNDVESYKPKTGAAGGGATTPGPSLPSYEDIPLSNMRKTIAQRLGESKHTAPHYYITINADVSKLLKLREALNLKAPEGVKLSVNDMIVKACAKTLTEVPEANSSWMGEFVRQYRNVDISVAVATPQGLVTPIIKGVEGRGLASISSNMKDVGKRARDGKLKPDEYQGGTFTISNMGMFGIDQFTAIINPPHSCILAVGSTTDQLVPDSTTEKGFKVTKQMKLTLSADHRIVDGAIGARFTSALKRVLEEPLELLM